MGHLGGVDPLAAGRKDQRPGDKSGSRDKFTDLLKIKDVVTAQDSQWECVG